MEQASQPQSRGARLAEAAATAFGWFIVGRVVIWLADVGTLIWP